MRKPHGEGPPPYPGEPVPLPVGLVRLCGEAGSDPIALGDAHREVLRAFRALVGAGVEPDVAWRAPVREAMSFLGGQSDRAGLSMRDYDHRQYGPFLAISNEGAGAPIVRRFAGTTPKAAALGGTASRLNLGIAVDGERLGGVGEVPVGPEEFADIWFEAAGTLLMTTNVGSRANLRFYRRPPVVALGAGDAPMVLAKAEADLAAAFRPFLTAPGGPRPLTVFVDVTAVAHGDAAPLLVALREAVQAGVIAAPAVQEIGLHVRVESGAEGRDAALAAVGLAASTGLQRLTIDGVVRPEADAALSLPGLLDYLPPEHLGPILVEAKARGVSVEPINPVDADTVAREVWSALSTVRGMGFDLAKYSLVPLTLEEADAVIGQVQAWFRDWSAAPVFYVDQGLLTSERIYSGADTAAGVEVWLRMVARHNTPLVLVDTVDKSQGWKLVKVDGDPKGLLTLDEIGHLEGVARGLGVNVMWAGGLEADQALALGRLGVFGIYVTTAVCDPAPVVGEAYERDPGLAALKRPDPDKMMQVKLHLEAGFLTSDGVTLPTELKTQVEAAMGDPVRLRGLLERVWAVWLGAARD